MFRSAVKCSLGFSGQLSHGTCLGVGMETLSSVLPTLIILRNLFGGGFEADWSISVSFVSEDFHKFQVSSLTNRV